MRETEKVLRGTESTNTVFEFGERELTHQRGDSCFRLSCVLQGTVALTPEGARVALAASYCPPPPLRSRSAGWGYP